MQLPSMFHIYKAASNGSGFEHWRSTDDFVSYIISERWQGGSDIEIVYSENEFNYLDMLFNQEFGNVNNFYFVYVSEVETMFVITSYDFTETYTDGISIILKGVDILTWLSTGHVYTLKEKEYKYNNRDFLQKMAEGISTINSVPILVKGTIDSNGAFGWGSEHPLYTSETISSTVDGGSSFNDIVTNYLGQMCVGFTSRVAITNGSSISRLEYYYTLPQDRTKKLMTIKDGQLSSIRFYRTFDNLVNHVTEYGVGFDDKARYVTDTIESSNNKFTKRMHFVNSSVSVSTIKQLYGEDNPNIQNATWVNEKIDMVMHADGKKFLEEPVTLMECVYNHNYVEWDDNEPAVGDVFSVGVGTHGVSSHMIVQEKIISKSGSEESVVLTLQDTKEIFPWL